ncbi:MAG: hypothetical protein ACFFC7_02745 [Candidatus Hermodarchaeota archaeon]
MQTFINLYIMAKIDRISLIILKWHSMNCEGYRITIKSKTKKLILNKHEMEFIEFYGKTLASHGSPETLGQIFALLTLYARNPENGLNQQEIAPIIDTHVSTVSRAFCIL